MNAKLIAQIVPEKLTFDGYIKAVILVLVGAGEIAADGFIHLRIVIMLLRSLDMEK